MLVGGEESCAVMTTLTAFVLTLQVTLGGGGAIAIGSESYGEVHWPCPDPALETMIKIPLVGDRRVLKV